MAIPFKCPTCGATGKAGSKLIGTVTKCPKCGAMVQVDEVFPAAPPELQPAVEVSAEEAWGRSTATVPPEPQKPTVRVVPRKSTLNSRLISLVAFSLVSLIVGGAIGMKDSDSPIASVLCVTGVFGLVGAAYWFTLIQDAMAPKPPPPKELTDREIMLRILEANRQSADRLGCLLWIVGVAFALSVIGALLARNGPY